MSDMSVEDQCMHFATLLTTEIRGVEPKALAATVKEASNVKTTLCEAYDSWIVAIQTELQRQAAEQAQALTDAGLLAAPVAPDKPKRGRKSKAEKETEDAAAQLSARGDIGIGTASAFDAE